MVRRDARIPPSPNTLADLPTMAAGLPPAGALPASTAWYSVGRTQPVNFVPSEAARRASEPGQPSSSRWVQPTGSEPFPVSMRARRSFADRNIVAAWSFSFSPIILTHDAPMDHLIQHGQDDQIQYR